MRRLCVLMVTGTLCACGTEQPMRGWETSVDTLPGGVIRVVNHPPPAMATAWSLEEILRVGTIDGDGPASFSRIHGLVVLDDERFAVLDDITQEVRVFAADGTHVVTHGRKGGGPGEFEGAFGLMRDSRGLLWVPDYRNARMSVIDPDLGLQWSGPLQVLSRGFVWQGAMLDSDHVWKPSITLGPPRANVMRVYSPEAELVDSLALPPDPVVDLEDPPGSFLWRSSDGRSGGVRLVPYFPHGESVIDPSGAIWSTAYGDPSYRIARWEPEGDTTLILETRRPPIGIPPSERDSAISVVREALMQRGAANQDWTKVPTTRPAVVGLFMSEDGDLWVRTQLRDSEVFDVYDRAGMYDRTVLNSLKLYRWVRPVVRGDDLWAVVTDEFDVHYVVRARLVPTMKR